MSKFKFNPDLREFPLIEGVNNSSKPSKKLSWKLWRLDLFYVYIKIKNKEESKQSEQKIIRKSFSQFVTALLEEDIISLYQSGFFKQIKWVKIEHEHINEKPSDGWLEYNYIMDVDKDTENKWIKISNLN